MKVIGLTARNSAGIAVEHPACIQHLLSTMLAYRSSVIIDLATLEKVGLLPNVVMAVIADAVPEAYVGKVIVVPTVERAIESCEYCVAPFRPDRAIIFGSVFEATYTKAEEIVYATVSTNVAHSGVVVLQSDFDSWTKTKLPAPVENGVAVSIDVFTK